MVHDRLRARREDASDADWPVYLQAAQRWEPSSPRTRHWVREIITNGGPDQALGRALEGTSRAGVGRGMIALRALAAPAVLPHSHGTRGNEGTNRAFRAGVVDPAVGSGSLDLRVVLPGSCSARIPGRLSSALQTLSALVRIIGAHNTGGSGSIERRVDEGIECASAARSRGFRRQRDEARGPRKGSGLGITGLLTFGTSAARPSRSSSRTQKGTGAWSTTPDVPRKNSMNGIGALSSTRRASTAQGCGNG